MFRLIKILHIDPDYQTTYFIFRDRLSIRTSVPLETAIELLKKEDFDLIISEPHNKAILKKQPRFVEPKPISADDQPFWEADHGDFSEVRPKVSLNILRLRQIWRSNSSFQSSLLIAPYS